MVIGIILGLILSALIYFGGGWCIYNIYLSICPINENMTFAEIYSNQILVYALVALLFNFLSLWRAEKLGKDLPQFWTYAMFIPLGLWFLSKLLPISEGFAILNTVINIITTTACFAIWLDEEI